MYFKLTGNNATIRYEARTEKEGRAKAQALSNPRTTTSSPGGKFIIPLAAEIKQREVYENEHENLEI
jgi:hypothetical protein